MNAPAPKTGDGRLKLTIAVAAIGYLVDVYDMFLFTIYRLPSLRDLGVSPAAQLSTGVSLFNLQVIGLVLGGALWGILGDKRGRTSVLLGSILVYSLANIANAFVQTVEQYQVLRLLAGIGLAGEIGAAVTLISEGMNRYKRGYGSLLLYVMGPLGATAAAFVGARVAWRTGYLIGGAMGLVLVALRARVLESHLFRSMLRKKCDRGDVRLLFRRGRWKTYLCVVLVGLPSMTGTFLTAFLPELTKATGLVGTLTINDGVFIGQLGLLSGCLFACLMSQRLKSRKQVIFLCVLVGVVSRTILLLSHGLSVLQYGALTMIGGFSSGYGVIFVTVAAELFGTNLRSTVATTVPNVVRASMVLMNLTLLAFKPVLGLPQSAFAIMTVTAGLALLAVLPLEETFGKDLNYVET